MGRPTNEEIAARKALEAAQDEGAEGTDTPKKKATAEVTYIPGDGDPHTVKWAGITFKGHMPVTVPLTHSISVPIRKEHVLADGTVQSRNVETQVSLVSLAKTNPSFIVDGEQAQKKAGTARTPTDDKEYRGYAISWIAASNSAKEMDTRWAGEGPLREACGIESKDLAYILPFFEARKSQCDGVEMKAA